MASKQSTARKPKSQPKTAPVVTIVAPRLTESEIRRIAEKLAVAVENNAEDIALLTMLFDHLEQVFRVPMDFSLAIYQIKKALFADTSAADDAQEKFQADAYANRGKLLQWPYERKETA